MALSIPITLLDNSSLTINLARGAAATVRDAVLESLRRIGVASFEAAAD
jgi:hypothetical protein